MSSPESCPSINKTKVIHCNLCVSWGIWLDGFLFQTTISISVTCYPETIFKGSLEFNQRKVIRTLEIWVISFVGGMFFGFGWKCQCVGIHSYLGTAAITFTWPPSYSSANLHPNFGLSKVRQSTIQGCYQCFMMVMQSGSYCCSGIHSHINSKYYHKMMWKYTIQSLYKCYPDAENVHMKRLKEAAALLRVLESVLCRLYSVGLTFGTAQEVGLSIVLESDEDSRAFCALTDSSCSSWVRIAIIYWYVVIPWSPT